MSRIIAAECCGGSGPAPVFSGGDLGGSHRRVVRDRSAGDTRSDIRALGVILYELASGVPPSQADSLTDLALRIAIDLTPPLRVAGSPAGFDRVIYRCLGKDPARPPPDAAAPPDAVAPAPDAAEPAVRKITRPKPRPQAGSGDDVGDSRL